MAAGQNGTDGAYVLPHVDQGTGQELDFVIVLSPLMAEYCVTEILPIWIFAIPMNVLVCILMSQYILVFFAIYDIYYIYYCLYSL